MSLNECRLIDLPKVTDWRGNLTFIEGTKHVPFEIKRVYYPEVEQLLRGTLGASRVFIFDHNVRNAARAGLAPPSRQVHNDHTVNSAPRRVRDHLGAEADELLKHGSVSSFADAPWFTQALGDYLQSKPVGLSKRDFSLVIRPATIEETSIYQDFAREFADMTDCLLFAPVS